MYETRIAPYPGPNNLWCFLFLLTLMQADIEAAVSASYELTEHQKYEERYLLNAMQDSGPVFEYAHNFVRRAVQHSKRTDGPPTIDSDISFSIHSNVGIKLLQYGADNLGLAHFSKAAQLDPTHAGMQVRVSMVCCSFYFHPKTIYLFYK
jgi:hypothetical protein